MVLTIMIVRIAEEAVVVAQKIVHARPEAPPIFVLVLAWLFLCHLSNPGALTNSFRQDTLGTVPAIATPMLV